MKARMKARVAKKQLKKAMVCVVCFPDWEGGNYYGVMPSGYKPEEFEYIEWEGTIEALIKQNPVFVESCEPFHEPRREWEVTGWELAQRWIKQMCK